MIDVQTESLIRLGEAAKLFPSPPSSATLFRWVLHGVRGQKLDSELVGGVRYTSAAAVQRFITRSGSPALQPVSTTEEDRVRIAQSARQAIATRHGV